jgi:hypothetical protein
MPSKSVLDLDVKALIVETITAGEVRPSSREGGLGLGGTKSLGSSDVGLTVSDILEPAVVKKLLNSSAIRVLSDMDWPFTEMVSILLFACFVLIASFSRSHVFLGFFACSSRFCSKYSFLLQRFRVF